MQSDAPSPASVLFLPPAPARAFGRRSMMRGGLAALGLVVMGAGGVAATAASSAGETAAAPVIMEWPALTAEDHQQWALFKAKMLLPEGRIVDTGNRGASHSEGQGLGLLFAVTFDDPAAFDAILAWTSRTLRRADGLHAWRWLPAAAESVPDTNNATDGDIYIAAALWRAAARWQRPDYAALAEQTARSVHDTLLHEVGDRLVLLPGGRGFTHHETVVVNLSYYAFPLLGDLAAAHPSERWARMQRDGVALAEAGRFGQWGLPPDWLEIRRADGSLAPARNFPARFSWDAVRVPLFLAWAGKGNAVVQAAAAFWQAVPGKPPAWVDLQTGLVAEYGAPTGIRAIAGVACRGASCPVPQLAVDDVYYSAALTLLSRIAVGAVSRQAARV